MGSGAHRGLNPWFLEWPLGDDYIGGEQILTYEARQRFLLSALSAPFSAPLLAIVLDPQPVTFGSVATIDTSDDLLLLTAHEPAPFARSGAALPDAGVQLERLLLGTY